MGWDPRMPSVRVLVTGATGKVGHAVTRALLERGDDVRALVRDPAAAIPAGAEPVPGDVRDTESLVEALRADKRVADLARRLETEVAAGAVTPTAAARRVLEAFLHDL